MMSPYLTALALLVILHPHPTHTLQSLEERVAELETSLAALEPLLVARYGLVRQCEVPQVQNGEAVCPTKLKPGALCRVRCYPGYIKTPGRTESRCKQGGLWSRQMQCE